MLFWYLRMSSNERRCRRSKVRRRERGVKEPGWTTTATGYALRSQGPTRSVTSARVTMGGCRRR